MSDSKCPVTGKSSRQVAGGGTSNRDWWPNQLNLQILHQQSTKSNPMGEGFNYRQEFTMLDLAAVKKDLVALMMTSDWCRGQGHYGSDDPDGWNSAVPIDWGLTGRRVVQRLALTVPDNVNWTRPAGCSGRSSRNTAEKYPGLT